MKGEGKEISSFDEARRTALMEDLFGFLQGRPVDLLSFDEVKEKLQLKQLIDRGVQEVPLEQIVGSLGREQEFNRAFLPREESLRKRWQEVKSLAEGPSGFPAIELYYVNDVYFVVDGHHRVSVARSVSAQTIEAQVKEFISPVLLTSDTSIEEVIMKSNLADFLQTTGLVQKNPTDYIVTLPNGYEKLLDHISVHRYFLGIETQSSIQWSQAVESWKTTVYDPMIEIIRKHSILQHFEGHTETDLYLFIMDHLHYLRKRYAPKSIRFLQAARNFARTRGTRKKSWWRRKPKKK